MPAKGMIDVTPTTANTTQHSHSSQHAQGSQVPSTFGEAMERLEAIVSQLEANEALGLEEALALYEQGVALAGDCRGQLAAAQLRLTEIAVVPGSVPGTALGVASGAE